MTEVGAGTKQLRSPQESAAARAAEVLRPEGQMFRPYAFASAARGAGESFKHGNQ
jgi:hypothetical protein